MTHALTTTSLERKEMPANDIPRVIVTSALVVFGIVLLVRWAQVEIQYRIKHRRDEMISKFLHKYGIEIMGGVFLTLVGIVFYFVVFT